MIRLTIIKVGGQVIDDSQKLSELLSSFAALPHPKILVHGGGKKASAISKSLGIKAQLIDGRRITNAETLKVVTMVYAGLINKNIVAQLQALGCQSMGLSGADADLIRAHKRPVGKIDYGFAGDVEKVDADKIRDLLSLGNALVFCPITHNGEGQLLNTNADTIATELAVACSTHFEVEIRYCFERPGVLLDAEDDATVIDVLRKRDYEKMLAEGAVHSGMIPKLDNAFTAKSRGLKRVVVGNWQLASSGTQIVEA